MKTRLLLTAAVVVVLSGCSTASAPMALTAPSPPVPASITFDASYGSISYSGSEHAVTVAAHVWTADGEPITGQKVSFAVSGDPAITYQSALQPLTDAQGVARLTYTRSWSWTVVAAGAFPILEHFTVPPYQEK